MTAKKKSPSPVDSSSTHITELEASGAALSVVNAIQDGLAAGLDIDAIFERAGERIADIFPSMGIALYTFDPDTQWGEAKFILEDGVRHYPPPFESGPIGKKAASTKQPLLISSRKEFEEIGAITIPGTAPSLSGIYMPLLLHDRPVGALNIESTTHEYAFGDDHVRLVTTIARSLSVALENARLFDEVHRSNLELSEALESQLATSEILQVMAASQVDIQPVLDSVAQNAARLCQADDVQIYRVIDDALFQVAHFGPLPGLKDGESLPLVPGLITGRVVLNRETIHIEDTAAISKEDFPESVKLLNKLKHRTTIATPLLWEGEATGAIVVRRNQVKPFSEKQVALLSTFANQAAIAIENVRLFNETARLLNETEERNAELAIINTVQRALAAQLDIQGIYEAVGEKLRQIFDTQVIALYTSDLDQRTITTTYAFEKGQRFEPVSIPLSSLHDHLIDLQGTYVFNGDFPEFASQFEDYHVSAGELPKSLVGVPVGRKVDDRQIVTLTLQDVDGGKIFTDSDVRLLETLANSMSVALENAHLFDETQRLLKVTEERNAELAVITSVQQGLASKLDMQSIYDLVGEKIRQTFDAQVVVLRSYDLQKTIEIEHYVIEKGERGEVPPYPLTPLTQAMIREKQILVINDDFRNRVNELSGADPVLPAGEMPRSAVFVPLFRGDDVVGSISLQNIDHENAFSDSDVALLRTLANAMSISLDNARLFDETQRLLVETEQRAAELQIINSVQEGLAARSDLQGIYDLIGDTLRDLFGAESMYIAIVEQPEDLAHFVYFLAMGERVFGEPPTPPTGFGGHVYSTRQPLIWGDITDEDMREYGSFYMGPQDYESRSRSFMGAPIISGNQVLGMVSILNRRKDFFKESDLRLLSTLTNSMGIALENARLFDETQHLLKVTEQRAAELQIINSVQEGLASKLEMQAIYDLVGEKIREIFQADTTFIAFHNPETNMVVAPYYSDKGVLNRASSRPYGQGLVELIVESGQPLVFNTAQESTEAGAFLIASPGSDRDMNQSFLGVPIYRDGKPIGATSVQSYKPYNFDQNDLSLLQTLTNSMSVAIENARLFDETQRLLEKTELRAAELATINAVGQALVAESELDALIELIGEKMVETFAADVVYVALLDKESQMITFPYTQGEEFEPIRLGEGLTSKIILTGKPILINEEMDKRRAEMGVTKVGVSAQSYLGVPIQIGGTTFGVISVQSTSEEGRFDQSDLHLLSTIAANVAAALRNAQLFEEVKRQSEYYGAVIENSPAAIVLLDLDANITGWNPAAEKLFGYSEAEALGQNVDDLVAKTDELHAEAVRYSKKALQEKQVHLLARRTRKDGSLVEVEVSGVPITVDGKQEVFIAIYHDVSELQKAREAAEEANRAKSTFLANMSHELRTPLNAILGFTRIVRKKGEGVLPEKQVENLDKVLVSAEHLLNLINTVLDISKIEAGRVDVEPTTFELQPLVEQVVGTSQTLLRKGVSLETDLHPELPQLFSDQEKIKQILLNLLSNAAKFTHQGVITLASRHDGDRLYIDVNDTGIGVSEDALVRIFEDFQQADSSTTREYGGTGLGLPISRSLARLLGGELTACSIEGEGSTFTLTIPLRYKATPTESTKLQSEAAA